MCCANWCACVLFDVFVYSPGTFYEGVMTKGFASNETDAAVLANIVAAGYSRSGGGGSTTTQRLGN